MSEPLTSIIDRLRPEIPRKPAKVRHKPNPVKVIRETAWDMVSAGRQFCAEDPAGHLNLVAPLTDSQIRTDGPSGAYLKLSGKYVKAGQPNVNGAFWTSDDLWFGLPTVTGGPVNYLHDERLILGAIMASSVVSSREQASAIQWATPTTTTMTNMGPIAETTFKIDPQPREVAEKTSDHVAVDMVLWRWLNIPLIQQVERAAKDGQLWTSMECVSETVTCMSDKHTGRLGCGRTYAYNDPNPCEHIQRRESVRHYQNPTFLGGAVIVPPVSPGWPGAVLEVAGDNTNTPDRVQFDQQFLHEATIHPRTVLDV